MFEEVPEWKTLPFEAQTPVYLYELTLLDEPENDDGAISAALLSAPLISTRMGVLFPVDLRQHATEESFETTFSKTKNDKDDSVLVARLTFRLTIREGLSCEQLADLIYMNRVLLNWKNYGVGYHKVSTETGAMRSSGSANGLLSTYLFCPLIQTENTRNNHAAISVDWNMLRCERRREAALLIDKSKVDMDDIIQNRMVVHRKLRYRLVGLAHDMTALSPFPCDNLSAERLQSLREKYNLDLQAATFADYYEKKYGAYTFVIVMLFSNWSDPLTHACLGGHTTQSLHPPPTRYARPVSEKNAVGGTMHCLSRR